MNNVEELLAHNATFAASFGAGDLPAAPARRLAILTCMDARLDPASALGLAPGDAHVIRNAGGIVTDDARRSLVVSQHLLGTNEIWLVHHTGCGMEGLDDAALSDRLATETGTRPAFAFGGFADARADLSAGLARLRGDPLLASHVIRAFLYDVSSGRVEEVFDTAA